ncbi:MAG: RNase adapter RapZ [Eubacteriales bacterium]
MEFLIITGLSGAGKSNAAKIVEDMGFFCVDNLPVPLISSFLALTPEQLGDHQRVAFVIDIRAGEQFPLLFDAIAQLKVEHDCSLLFLDCDDFTIIKHYKESRRSHPLTDRDNGLVEAIQKERKLLETARLEADYIVDASTSAQMKAELHHLFADESKNSTKMKIRITSFGFKYGLPIDADLVFDVRFLPNPYYVEELRIKTGLMKEVSDYVFQCPEANDFLEKLKEMVLWLLPHYEKEGKTSLIVAIGCTGGHHRSVALCHALSTYIEECGYAPYEGHRDITKMKE